MNESKVLKGFLAISGLLLTFIGGSTLFAPIAMKASAGIDIAGNISVINDTRASGALILAIALLSISGVFVKQLTFTSAITSTLLFLSLGIGRIVSILLDGMPVDGLVKATGLEMILGTLGLFLFFKNRVSNRAIKPIAASFLLLFTTGVSAQKTDKKVIQFSVERVIEVPASQVWKVVGEDFGAIANSHPKIVSSQYNQGHITGGENVTRTCNFNEKGTKYVHEKQVSFDAENYTFKVLIYQAGGLPINSDYSYGVYTVKPIDNNSCKLVMDMTLRTKPSFLGSLAKAQFKGDIADYLLAVDHHVRTGEIINKENFKEIKKKYTRHEKK